MGGVPAYGLVYLPPEARPFTVMYNDTHANMSLAGYIEMYRGPKHLPMPRVIPITILYAAIFITGVIGNSLVCYVISKNRHMHSATNFYLYSLSISDLTLLLLGLPNDLQIYWKQYPWEYGLFLCKARAVVSEWSSYSSVVVIVAFSVERYLAICQPFQTYQMSTLQRSKRVIAGVWIVSFISALPIGYLSKVYYLDFPPGSGQIVEESAFCATLLHVRPGDKDYVPVYEFSCVMFFLLPMTLIAFMYTKIYLTLKARERTSLRRPSRKEEKAKKQIVTMLAAVVVTFFICWAPFHLQRLFIMHATDHPNYQNVNEYLYYITGVVYYFSATMNPILYSALSKKFRDAFRLTLSCSLRRSHDRSLQQPHPTSGGPAALRQRFDLDPSPTREPAVKEEVPVRDMAVQVNEMAEIELHNEGRHGRVEVRENGTSPMDPETEWQQPDLVTSTSPVSPLLHPRMINRFLPIVRATAKETYI